MPYLSGIELACIRVFETQLVKQCSIHPPQLDFYLFSFGSHTYNTAAWMAMVKEKKKKKNELNVTANK